jgi:hypothetical protein
VEGEPLQPGCKQLDGVAAAGEGLLPRGCRYWAPTPGYLKEWKNIVRTAQFRLVCCLSLCPSLVAEAQTVETPTPQVQNDTAATEREVREFFDSYAEDLRRHRRQAIANRYDRHGYFRVGNGIKTLVSFDEVKHGYLTEWTGPKSFTWRDLSIDVLSPDAAVVTGLFDWQNTSGWTVTYSYTGLVKKDSGNWLIRHIVGDRARPGPFKYTLKAPPGTSIAAHRHSVEMRVSVSSGLVCILMGDFATARVQCFETGSTFVIPAGVWHVEWWEAETHVEVEGIGPMRTEMASPSTPRTP